MIELRDYCQFLIKFGIKPGYYTMESCTRADLERIKQSDCKLTDGVKVRWKTLRAIRKDFNDKHELDEGRHMPVDHFNCVFISELSKLLCWVISEIFNFRFLYLISMISRNLMRKRHLPVDHFSSVFISDLSKSLFLLISENFQLSLSWFEFFAIFSDGDFLIFWKSTNRVKVRQKTFIAIRKGFNG